MLDRSGLHQRLGAPHRCPAERLLREALVELGAQDAVRARRVRLPR
jgi:hypothetical protein